MNTTNIDVVGVTSHTDGDTKIYTAFIFDFPESNYFGVVYRMVNIWRVISYGQELPFSQKEIVRRTVSSLNQDDFPYIDNHIALFQERGKEFKPASQSQMDFLRYLFNTTPKEMCSAIASELINYLKFYNAIIDEQKANIHRDSQLREVIEKMNAFKLKDHSMSNSTDFVNEFLSIIRPCYELYQDRKFDLPQAA